MIESYFVRKNSFKILTQLIAIILKNSTFHAHKLSSSLVFKVLKINHVISEWVRWGEWSECERERKISCLSKSIVMTLNWNIKKMGNNLMIAERNEK